VFTADELHELTSRLAEKFETNLQEESDECDAHGWGQFLDNPKPHLQVGPYGTSAGLVVLALAVRGQSNPVTEAQRLLGCWWALRDNPENPAHRLYVQTLRLAFQHLALGLSVTSFGDQILNETRAALLARVLTSKLWGNYWTNDSVHDPTPRTFPSAMVILSFTLMKKGTHSLDHRVTAATDQLEPKLSVAGLSLLERAAIAAALVTVKGNKLSRKTSRRIDQLARLVHPNLNRQETYFFDFEFLPGPQNRIYSRDYFIVSPEVLLAIAGFQPGAPPSLRLMAERTINVLINNLKQNGGVYRPSEGSRVSTIDQAWACLLLSAAAENVKSLPRRSKIKYELLRTRRDNWFTAKFLPSVSTLIVVASNVALSGAGLTLRILSALALAVVASIYGPRVFRRLLPGGEDF
jgi:hypothetical protein